MTCTCTSPLFETSTPDLDVTLRFSSQSPISSFWVPHQDELAPLSGYHPPSKLREGNVFSHVCSRGGGHVTITHDTSNLRKQDPPPSLALGISLYREPPGPSPWTWDLTEQETPQHPQTLDTNPLLRPPLQVTSGGIHWWNTFLLCQKPINMGSVCVFVH